MVIVVGSSSGPATQWGSYGNPSAVLKGLVRGLVATKMANAPQQQTPLVIDFLTRPCKVAVGLP